MGIGRMNNCKGYAYLYVLMIIIIMGVALCAAGQSWHTLMKREQEAELLFRGRQIRDAIARWYAPRPGEHAATPLLDLKDLLQDPRTPHTVRYLRRLYSDPITNGDWEIISDSVKGIQGVASTSRETPLKKSGFPKDLQDFYGQTRYSDWRFVYTATQRKPGAVAKKPN
ncbi:MAG TPA: type II secretion system protein [Geobacteraceae bacterium]|nr:type II secretion system protein [Geobacteraceae bacterium]